jgi:hypothetical protein
MVLTLVGILVNQAHTVILRQPISLDDADEHLGISWVGGIACRLQSGCPSGIIGRTQVEKRGIAAAP